MFWQCDWIKIGTGVGLYTAKHDNFISENEILYDETFSPFNAGQVLNIKSSFSLQTGHNSSLTATNLQPTANQERNDQCGNQHYSRELLMMGIVMAETCWAYKKHNKIISGI